MPLFRRTRKIGLPLHTVLLTCAAAGIISLWMLPVLAAGFPYRLPLVVLSAKEFVATGYVTPELSAVTLLLGAFSPFIGWNNPLGWAAVGCFIMALSLLPLWWAVYRLFDERTAWLTTIIFALLPLIWTEAVLGVGYPLAFLFLFLSIVAFIEIPKKKLWLRLVVPAVLFGLALASQHAFLTFIPWIVGTILWRRRNKFLRACLEAACFCVVAYVGFVLPLLPNALRPNLTVVERIQTFLPSPDDHMTGIGHLYPDEYAYTFLREEFDEKIQEHDKNAPFLVRLQEKYVRIIFGVGEVSVGSNVLNGLWLFLNTFPQLFVQEYVGGAFLWLFILPGMVYCYKKRKQIFWHIVSLWLTMELLLRFVLHYGRTHLMDVSFAIALFAAIGITIVVDALPKQTKRATPKVVLVIVALLVAFQLVQANRKLFAQEYARTSVPETYAAQTVLEETPHNAVIAHPRMGHLFFFSDRKSVVLGTDTLDLLWEQGKLKEPFTHYGVTHIIGYDDRHTRMIMQAMPQIQVLHIPTKQISVPLTPLIRFVLHLVR